MKLQITSAVLLVLLLSSCRSVTTESLNRQSELYASRITFYWENLGIFQLRGNARLQGSSRVARGPFVLWGDPLDGLLRGDFYGPDGRPVVSLMGDSTGMLIYMPQDEHAVFMPLGLQTGSGTIPTIDLIHLLRTGYPLILESWEITESALINDADIQWLFSASDSADRMILTLQDGDIFSPICELRTGKFSICGSSPHDEYNAWPWSWSTQINDSAVDIELTEINSTAVPWEGIWTLVVPIPIDTIDYIPAWQPVFQLEQR